MSPLGSVVPPDELTVTVPYGAAAVWGVDEDGYRIAIMIYPGPPMPLIRHKGFSVVDGPHGTRCPSCGDVILGDTRSQCNTAVRQHEHSR